MARMTVRLPDSLHEVLRERARAEGVSTNQYVVYALTPQSSLEGVVEQRARFEALRGHVREARHEAQFDAVLGEDATDELEQKNQFRFAQSLRRREVQVFGKQIADRTTRLLAHLFKGEHLPVVAHAPRDG